jgi:hypothetical protein
MDIIFYSALYWIGHSYLAFKFKNATSRLNLKTLCYRIWLFALDVITLQTLSFKNIYAEFNRYPIVFSFSILFYFMCRHCLRNQRLYQSIVHIYHPTTTLHFYGHYYIGFFYSVFDFVLKYSIVLVALHIQFALAMTFLLGLSFLDVWFYYNNITDSTSEIFHKLVGFLFHFVQPS